MCCVVSCFVLIFFLLCTYAASFSGLSILLRLSIFYTSKSYEWQVYLASIQIKNVYKNKYLTAHWIKNCFIDFWYKISKEKGQEIYLWNTYINYIHVYLYLFEIQFSKRIFRLTQCTVGFLFKRDLDTSLKQKPPPFQSCLLNVFLLFVY